MGNGKEGLAKSSIRLQESVNSLITVTEAVRTRLSAFEQFQIETEVTVRENEKHLTNRKWFIGLSGDGTFLNSGIGKDFTVTFNVIVNF